MTSLASTRKRVWERDNFTCRYCGKNMKELYFKWKERTFKGKVSSFVSRKKAQLVADHLIPRRLETLLGNRVHKSFNLVTSCRDCDKKKGGTLKISLIIKHIFINLVKS